jgi:hypothetical protein
MTQKTRNEQGEIADKKEEKYYFFDIENTNKIIRVDLGLAKRQKQIQIQQQRQGRLNCSI